MFPQNMILTWGIRSISLENRQFLLCFYRIVLSPFQLSTNFTAAVAQWVRALAPQAKCWVFESQLRQI